MQRPPRRPRLHRPAAPLQAAPAAAAPAMAVTVANAVVIVAGAAARAVVVGRAVRVITRTIRTRNLWRRLFISTAPPKSSRVALASVSVLSLSLETRRAKSALVLVRLAKSLTPSARAAKWPA